MNLAVVARPEMHEMAETLAAQTADWMLLLKSSEWLPPAGHVSISQAKYFMPPIERNVPTEHLRWLDSICNLSATSVNEAVEQGVDGVPDEVDVMCCPYFWVDDELGNSAKVLTREAWAVRRRAAVELTPYGFKPKKGLMLVLPSAPVLRRIGGAK